MNIQFFNADALQTLIPGAPFWLIIAILVIAILPNIWAIWHAGHSSFPYPVEQFAWVGLAAFLPVVGGLIYIFSGQKRSMPLPVENKNK